MSSESDGQAFVVALLALPSRAEQRLFMLAHRDRLSDDALRAMHKLSRESILDGHLPTTYCVAHAMARAADLTGSMVHRALSHVARANGLLFGSGKYVRAARSFALALDLYEADGRDVDGARVRVSMSLALLHAGDPTGAEEMCLHAQPVFRRERLWPDLVRAYHHLAIIHGKQGHDDKAMAAAGEAIDLLREHDLSEGAEQLAALLGDRALVLRNMGRHDEAVGDFQEAIARLDQAGVTTEAARCRQNLGVTYLQLGRFMEGFRLLERARAVFLSDQRYRHAGRLDLYVAEYLLALRRFSEALDRCRSAAEVFAHTSGDFDLAQTRLLEGDAHFGLNDPRAALLAYDESVRLFHNADNPFWATYSGLRRVRARYAAGELVAGVKEAAVTFSDLQRMGARVPQSEALLMEAEGRMRLHQPAAAASCVSAASDLIGMAGTPALAQQLHHLRSSLRAGEGDLAGALDDCDLAMAAMETMLGHMMVEYRMGFMEDKEAVFRNAVRISIDLGLPERAFEYSERARSRVLNDLVGGRVKLDLRSLRETDKDLVATFNKRVHDRDVLLRRLSEFEAEEEGQIAIEPDQRDPAVRELSALEREIAVAWNGLLERDADYAIHQTRWVERREPLSVSMDGDQALLEYYLDGDSAVAFIVTAQGVEAVRIGLNADRVHTLLDHLALILRSGPAKGDSGAGRSRVLRLLEALHAICLAPLRSALAPYTRLTIVPHGPLHYVPFHALYDGTRHLIEDHEVSYLPSAGLLQRRTRHVEGPFESLVVGHSHKGLLPDTVAEARAVAGLLGASMLLEEEATVGAVLQRAPASRILHIAAHGEFWPSDPLFSGIELEDGWLKTVEVFSDLQLRASLVTLSACHTGRSRVAGGDEILGLTRAFLAAGARSLVMSLWAAHDASTHWLMLRFYGHLVDGMTKGAALRAAQRDFMAADEGPLESAGVGRGLLDWAPFVLVGDAGAL